ncbi:MAG: hypothetical protein H7Y88_09080 [Phycisphaerales bacterium]|nr:hypothetical protein [Phycisphaerales bacterium]
MHHVLRAIRVNLYGRFAAENAPVLTVESGDTVSFEGVPDVGWGLEPPTSTTGPRRRLSRGTR